MADNFTKKSFPKSRNLISDVMWLSRKKSMIHGLCEVDISITRDILKNYNSGKDQKVSLLSYILYCYSRSVEKFDNFNTIKKGRKIITYNDVDVSVIIERELDGKKFPMNYIIRNCNKLLPEEINNELTKAKSTPVGEIMYDKKINFFASLPAFIRRMTLTFISTSPRLSRQYFGTTGVTSTHTVIKGQFWGMPSSPATMAMTIGSIYRKVVKINDGLTEREFICLTFSADHELNDGADGIRLFNHFKEMLESGYGLK